MAKSFIRVYTQRGCRPCTSTKTMLTKAGVEFEELPAQENLDVFESLLAEKQAPLVVVLEHWGDAELIVDHWNGYQPEKIKEYL